MLFRVQPESNMLRNHTAGALQRLIVLGAMLPAASIWACSVPVFRYALEKWPADSYQAIVFHRGPLSAAQQGLASELSDNGRAGRLRANVSVQLVDLAQGPAPDELELWRRLGADTLPWLVVRYPHATRLQDNIVSGQLNESTVKQSLNSPARKEIARRLYEGDSAVWVLLEIGDRKRDEEAAIMAESRLSYLASVLKLPTLDPRDIATGLVSVPAGGLKLAFSVVRVSRTDPAETAFVKMLLGTEPDLAGIKEPILIPVFGRGRALYAMAGKGINHETLDEAATFLIGKCSCQVKELNPGVDLLLSADWDAALKSQPITSRGEPVPPSALEPAPEMVTISGSTGNPSLDSTRPPLLYDKLGWAGGLAVAALIAGLFLLWRK